MNREEYEKHYSPDGEYIEYQMENPQPMNDSYQTFLDGVLSDFYESYNITPGLEDGTSITVNGVKKSIQQALTKQLEYLQKRLSEEVLNIKKMELIGGQRNYWKGMYSAFHVSRKLIDSCLDKEEKHEMTEGEKEIAKGLDEYFDKLDKESGCTP